MPASWWGQETPGWSGHFCCLSAAVCGNLKPRLIAKDPWQVTNTWDNLRLFNTFRNKIRNIWKHIIMRWSMGWCKGTCARKTMFVYMFYTMVLAPIRSFSLFFSLQFSRLSWSRRSQGTHFHQVIGICDAAAASDPQCFSMGSIFFIKKTICFTAGSEHLQPSSKICFGKLPENDGPMWENTIFTLEPLLIMNVGYIWFLSPSWFYKRIIYNNAPTRNIQTQCWDIPILTISYRVTPQWGQYIRTYIIINIYYVCSQTWYLPLYITHM